MATCPDSGLADDGVHGSVDPFLQLLVSQVDAREWSVGITLYVGGSVVIGNLASVTQYFQYFTQEFAKAARSEDPEVLARPLAPVLEQNRDLMNSDEYRPLSIHLKDALLFIPAGTTTMRIPVPWWRGRLARVDGFVIGRPDV